MQIEMKCITYGCGNTFDGLKLQPIINDREAFLINKPRGGLWSSPVDSKWGWYDWSKANDFGDLSTSFRFIFKGNAVVINDYRSICELPSLEGSMKFFDSTPLIDFESVAEFYDAIFVRCGALRYLRAWDCETVLVFNRESIILEASAR
jgi:hypothetical protein